MLRAYRRNIILSNVHSILSNVFNFPDFLNNIDLRWIHSDKVRIKKPMTITFFEVTFEAINYNY